MMTPLSMQESATLPHAVQLSAQNLHPQQGPRQYQLDAFKAKESGLDGPRSCEAGLRIRVNSAVRYQTRSLLLTYAAACVTSSLNVCLHRIGALP